MVPIFGSNRSGPRVVASQGRRRDEQPDFPSKLMRLVDRRPLSTIDLASSLQAWAPSIERQRSAIQHHH